MFNATITHKINITDDLIVLGVAPDGGVPDFKPGQYIALGLPGGSPRSAKAAVEEVTPDPDKIIKRAYSIGSSPLQKEFLEFYIAVVNTGSLTPRLDLLKEGDRVFCGPKITGHFTLDPVPADQNLILVSTGTGLAPFISMIRTPSTWTIGRKITILHGVRYARDLAYREELLSLAKENPLFTYKAIISREDYEGTSRGYVQKFFSDKEIEYSSTKDHVLLCGNPGMIDDVEKLLTSEGYIVHSKKTPGNLHYEKYW